MGMEIVQLNGVGGEFDMRTMSLIFVVNKEKQKSTQRSYMRSL